MSNEDSSGEGKTQDTFTADTPIKDSNVEIYENRGPKKIIRIVTVMAYLFSVSFVGILLSAYYIFLWEPPNPRFMQRERLRMDPQMQLLIAPSSEQTDLTKKDSSFLLQSDVNHVHKPFLAGRMAYDNDDSVVSLQDKMDLEKKQRLDMILLKLRHSLVDTLRAQNRNLSQETVITNEFNNSFLGVEKVLNSTISRTENTISRHHESHGNTSERKTYSDNTDLPPEFTDSVLNVKSTSSTANFTIPETETNQTHFDENSVTNVNPTIEEKNHKKKLDTVELYLIRRFNNTTNSDVTNSSEPRVLADNSFKMIQRFLKIDRKELMKQNKISDRRSINNVLGDVQTSVALNDNIKNRQKNYSNGNKSFSKNQITHDTVSIDLSSHNLVFTENPGFHQTPDDPTVIKSQPRTTGTRNSEEPRMQLPRKMSAHNVMASIGRTLGNRESKASAPNEVRFAGDERKDKLYEPKHKQKLIRVLTVVAYVIFVSMAAILLSLYYTFVWNPKDQAIRKTKPDSKSECFLPKLFTVNFADSHTTPSISNETQIERMTANSTTIDNKQLEQIDLSATQQQKSVSDIFTEITNVEETSVELTSISTTTQDYHNFTNIMSEDDESVT